MNKPSHILRALISLVIISTVQSEQSQQATINAPEGIEKHANIQINIPIQNSNANDNLLKSILSNLTSNQISLTNTLLNTIKTINNTDITTYNQQLDLLFQHFKTAGNDIKNRALGLCAQTKKLLWDHKFKLTSLTLLSLYAYLLFYVYQGNTFLKKPTLISSWKQEVSMELLLAIPQTTLSDELIFYVQGNYGDNNNPEELLQPFLLFQQALEREQKQLQNLVTLHTWINRLRLHYILPQIQEGIQQLQERIQRLTYYKNCFTSWSTNQRLESLQNALQ